MRVELDARCMGRLQVHDYLAQNLPLPDWYGRNLDALYDCLTELRDITLCVTHAGEAPPSFERVRRVLEDAAAENPDLNLTFENAPDDTDTPAEADPTAAT